MKTKFFTTILALLAIATTAQAQFGGGDGSKENPYIISTTDHMDYLAEQVNAGNTYKSVYFRLANDLDYSGKTYHVIGHAEGTVASRVYYYFQGCFDGDGKTIRNVTIDGGVGSWTATNICLGLFGALGTNGCVKNLTLGGTSSIKGRSEVGGIVGRAEGDKNRSADIVNCHVESGVTIEPSEPYNNENIGGIVGYVDRSVVSDCTSAATVIGNDEHSYYLGGVAGFVLYGTIRSCVNTGPVSGGYMVGGVAGKVYEVTVIRCTNIASVTGIVYVGGVVGRDEGGTTLTGNAVGGNCSLGAVGVSGSTQGTDAGYDVTHIYTVGFNSAQHVSGTIATPPTMNIGGTDYYASGSTISLSSLSTFGGPGSGNIWSFRATVSYSYYEEIFRQEDGTWQFTMPMGNAMINPTGTKDISLSQYPYATYVTLTPASATYNGSSQKPTVSVVCRANDLTEGTDFITDIPTAGYTNAGDYTFHIWGIGQYGGMRTESFTVAHAALTQLTLSETSVYHDGATHKPTLTVKSGSKTLTRGTDYETDLPDAGFTDLGNYTIKVWGIGNYDGELSATYTICHPWDGMGTWNEPFLIQNTDDMDRLATLVNGGKTYEGVFFRQAANLDFTGKTYTPVGNSKPFQGTFDGYYHNISGIDVSEGSYAGVFGLVGNQGTIRSVTITGTNSFSGVLYSGTIAGENYGTIESCRVVEGANVNVTSRHGGGIVGANYGTINSCENYAANVTASYAGGIVGLNSLGTIYATNYSTVTGSNCCGGIVGYNEEGTIVGQHFGTVSSKNSIVYCGGIVGYNETGIVEYSLSTDLMTSVEGSRCGAIVGSNFGTLTNNYYIGACKFKGIGPDNADVLGQAMRGWPISHDENIGFNPMPDASGNIIGTYYDDGTNNHYYVGEGELLRFMLYGGTGYTANGTALAVAGHDDDWDEDYYELTMSAAPVHIAPVGLTLTLYDNWVNNHNIEDISNATGETRSVIIEGRTLYKTGIWNTICLPFNLDNFDGTPLEGATVKELASSSYNASTQTLTLNFSTVSEIEAGKPYIVKWASGENVTNPVFENVVMGSGTASAVETDCIDFIGSYSIVSLMAQDRTVLYMGGDSKLYYPGSDMKVNAFRGFFRLKNGLTAGDLPNSAKAIVLDFGDETTKLEPTPNPSRREESDDYYSIDGRKLSGKPTQKGLYIYKGKKIVIR